MHCLERYYFFVNLSGENMQTEFGIVSLIIFGVLSGLLCYLAANYLQALAIRRRKGKAITWADNLGDVIDEKQTKCHIVYIAFDILFMVCAFALNHVIANTVFIAFVLVLLTAISITDMKFRIIPNSFSFILIGLKFLSFLIPLFYGTKPALPTNLLDSVGGFIIGLVIVGVFPCLIKGSIGGGDIKLAMAVGFLLGCRKTLLAIALAGLFCIPFIVFARGSSLIQRLRSKIPLGPPLCAAAITVLIASYSRFWVYVPSF